MAKTQKAPEVSVLSRGSDWDLTLENTEAYGASECQRCHIDMIIINHSRDRLQAEFALDHTFDGNSRQAGGI